MKYLYIFGVFPSNSGNSSSIGASGYVAGIFKGKLEENKEIFSYFKL